MIKHFLNHHFLIKSKFCIILLISCFFLLTSGWVLAEWKNDKVVKTNVGSGFLDMPDPQIDSTSIPEYKVTDKTAVVHAENKKNSAETQRDTAKKDFDAAKKADREMQAAIKANKAVGIEASVKVTEDLKNTKAAFEKAETEFKKANEEYIDVATAFDKVAKQLPKEIAKAEANVASKQKELDDLKEREKNGEKIDPKDIEKLEKNLADALSYQRKLENQNEGYTVDRSVTSKEMQTALQQWGTAMSMITKVLMMPSLAVLSYVGKLMDNEFIFARYIYIRPQIKLINYYTILGELQNHVKPHQSSL